MATGDISHIEFPAEDPVRARRFYTAVAGWEFGQMDAFPDYWLFRTGERAGGMGRFAVVRDTESSEVGLFEVPTEAPAG